MILERAEFPIKTGEEESFAKVMAEKGLAILAAAEGCHSARLARGIENPEKFILLLEWESVEHHIAMTKTAAFDRFKALAGPYFAGPSNMAHFALL